jgi:hypothetical protein
MASIGASVMASRVTGSRQPMVGTGQPEQGLVAAG